MDYNDGNWHGWNGGECPVHPKTVVAVLPCGAARDYTPKMESEGTVWGGDNHIAAFRVIKEHREAREFWIAKEPGECAVVWGHDPKYRDDIEVIKVREVIE